MIGTTIDWAEARKWMVDGQLRPNKVTDPRLVDALMEVERQAFVPAAQSARAYADADVPLPGGRAMLKPLAIARLIQLAALRPGDKALTIGGGAGYGAALMAHMGASVVLLDSDPALLAGARAVLPGTPGGNEVVVAEGPLFQGFAGGAPYDVVVVEGAFEAVPMAVVEQMREGGRLVGIRQLPGRSGVAVLGRRLGDGLKVTEAFDLFGRLLPGFTSSPTFSL
jgi:protein-L-isoaspartate(D-aspartate) O-methyltransferase